MINILKFSSLHLELNIKSALISVILITMKSRMYLVVTKPCVSTEHVSEFWLIVLVCFEYFNQSVFLTQQAGITAGNVLETH